MARSFWLLGIGGLATMAITGCSGDGKAIAALTYDLRGDRTLHAYAPEPAARNRQEDKLHKQLYGMVGDTKSPRTPYICVWRDTSSTGLGGNRDVRPQQIFLTCAFGTTDWEPPATLMEQAEARMRREEAVIRIQWDRAGDTYRMSRFETEIRDLPSKVDFRSANFGEAVAELGVEESGMKFPATRDDPFTFHIAASLPQRLNKGDKPVEPTASVTISGTAVPMPPWVMY